MKPLQIFVLLLLVALSAGLTENPHRETLLDLPHVIDELMVDWEVPGVSVAVVKDGELVFAGGFGTLEVAGEQRVSADTVFAIGSATKTFTAAAAQILVDEGLLDLDLPVRAYLPEFEVQDPYATLNLTPRDLLAHRTGLPRHDAMWYRSDSSRDELVARIRYLKPSSQLREGFHYSNLMYMIAGRLVGRQSGASWENFVRDRIFTPLSMKRSFLGVPPDPDLARPHVVGDDSEPVSVPFYDGRAVGPASSIYSSARDMGSWIQLLLAKGSYSGVSILSPERTVELWTPQTAVPGLGPRLVPITTYGLGLFVQTYRGHLFAWHSGSVDGYYSLVALLPNNDIGVVVLTNRSDHQLPEVVSRWIFDRFLGLAEINWNAVMKARQNVLEEAELEAEASREAARKVGTTPSLELEDYQGRYVNPAYGTIEVAPNDAGLAVSFHNMAGPLEHFHDDIFLYRPVGGHLRDDYVLSFQVTDDGRPLSLSSRMEDEAPPVVFIRMKGESDGDPAASDSEGDTQTHQVISNQ